MSVIMILLIRHDHLVQYFFSPVQQRSPPTGGSQNRRKTGRTNDNKEQKIPPPSRAYNATVARARYAALREMTSHQTASLGRALRNTINNNVEYFEGGANPGEETKWSRLYQEALVFQFRNSNPASAEPHLELPSSASLALLVERTRDTAKLGHLLPGCCRYLPLLPLSSKS